jgi:hypothetical protein
MKGKNTLKQLERYSVIFENEIKREIRLKKLVATGKLERSIRRKVKSTNKYSKISVLSVGAASKYIDFVEEGTKGGYFPNVRALRKWVRAKNIRPKNNKNQFVKINRKTIDRTVYKIGRSIQEKGIIKRYGGGAKFAQFVLDKYNKKMITDLTEAYKKDVEERLENTKNK